MSWRRLICAIFSHAPAPYPMGRAEFRGCCKRCGDFPGRWPLPPAPPVKVPR